MTKQEREERQRRKLEEMLSFERELWNAGKEYVAGVDEVGRGPLANDKQIMSFCTVIKMYSLILAKTNSLMSEQEKLCLKKEKLKKVMLYFLLQNIKV